MTSLPAPTPVEVAVRAFGVPFPTARDQAIAKQRREWTEAGRRQRSVAPARRPGH